MNNIINIERALLSSIIFDNEIFEEIELEAKHFILPFHQTLFETFKILSQQNKPLTEDFIVRHLGKELENATMDILSANPISNYRIYISEIKESFCKRTIDKNLKILQSNLHDTDLAQILKELETIINWTNIGNIFNVKSTANIKEKLPLFYLTDILPIQKNEVTMLSAPGGTGKSYVALYLLSLLVKNHNLKVLGFFSEDDVGITKHRLEQLRNIHKDMPDIDIVGKGDKPESFLTRDKNQNFSASEYFYKLKKQLKNYDVILIDPLIAFLYSDENSNIEARNFMNLLNEWCTKDKKTIIIIHHHSKAENATARGASAFIDASRLHYVIKSKKNNDTHRFTEIKKINHSNGSREYSIQLFKDTKTTVVETSKGREPPSEDELF